MDILETAQDLVDKVGVMLVLQLLFAPQNMVEIGIHQMAHDIDIVELVPRTRGEQVDDTENVLVIHGVKELNFAENTLAVLQLLEHVGALLDCHLRTRNGINGGDNEPVGPKTERLNDVVVMGNIKNLLVNRVPLPAIANVNRRRNTVLRDCRSCVRGFRRIRRGIAKGSHVGEQSKIPKRVHKIQ